MALFTAPVAAATVYTAARASTSTASVAAGAYALQLVVYGVLAWRMSSRAGPLEHARASGPLALIAAVLGAGVTGITPSAAPVSTLASICCVTLCLSPSTERGQLIWSGLAAVAVGAAVALGLARPLGDASVAIPVEAVAVAAIGFAFLELALLLGHRAAAAARVRELEASKLVAEQRAEERAVKLHAAVDEAVSASNAKADFLATMSHEIRTPMNAVIGMTSLLIETPLSREQAEYAQTIRRSSEHLLTIINDILDFSKIEAGMLVLDFVAFDVAELVEESLDFVSATAEAKGLDLAYVIADGTPARVTSDPTRLRQILANLLSNAVKFTNSGEVVVDVSWTPYADPSLGELEFAVRDTGIGIPEDKIDRLFKAFSQVETAASRGFGGTGLGLVIARNLADLMGGRTWVESRPGHGSTFSFTVGARVDDAQPKGAPSLAGVEVLVVDDNATNRSVLERTLERWGIRPTLAASGEEALELGVRFTLALIDHRMPGMDGIELARALRARSATMHLVLLSSAPIDLAAVRASGVDLARVLPKPLKLSRLFDEISRTVAGGAREAVEPPPAQLDATLAARLPMRILVAEDNVVNRRVVTAMLGRCGYAADVAADGEEAISMTLEHRYDLVLMDIQMPRADGLTATRAIRERERKSPDDTPLWIVALTANATQEDWRKCIDAGMDDYLSKPLKPGVLAAALTRAATRTPPPADGPFATR